MVINLVSLVEVVDERCDIIEDVEIDMDEFEEILCIILIFVFKFNEMLEYYD